MDVESEDTLLNVRETAKKLHVHENTVRNWARTGVLPEARVPGSRFHRFRLEDVERLIAQRGEVAPSLQTERRTINPELVTANQLKQWPATRSRDAQENFPELIRRLLVETPGVSNISMRTGDGVALAGFDGLAEAQKTKFLPAGQLAFELGVSNDPKAKATKDYDDRVARGDTRDRIFVFITPLRWQGKSAWADERRTERHFADVCVLDGDDLEGWLKTAPAAHHWISEHLGLRPRDALTLDEWWARLSASTNPVLPQTLFLAGRAALAQKLLEQLDGSAPRLTVVESEWLSDCLAFVHAALTGDGAVAGESLPTAVLVSAPEVWDRVLEQPGRAILIPRFDGADVGAALDRGHHVITVVDRAEVSRRGTDIALPRLDRRAASDAFQSAGIEFDRADRFAALGRRSLPALVRELSRNPRFSRPSWAHDSDATILASLVLVGQWTTSHQDIAALERLTGRTHDDIEQVALRVSVSTDPVLRRVGDTWTFASPEEAFLLLRDSLGQTALERWRAAIADLLLEADPLLDMPPDERMTARIRGVKERCSGTLRRGLAQGLALMGAMGVGNRTENRSTLSEVASFAVKGLLDEANDDETGRRWELLAPNLPLLAEAAPEVFLGAVEDGLGGNDPVILKLFREDEDGVVSLGPSSPHPHLLWALETLTWSEHYLVDGTRVLALIAGLEPGGKSGNRPASSLASILCGWVRNTSAPLETRLQAVDAVYRVSADVGWKLIFDLWPSNHGWVMPPASPRIRDDWRPTATSVPLTDWAAFVHGLVDRAVEYADADPTRLRRLVSGLGTVSPADRDRIIAFLETQSRSGRMDDDGRLQVWEKLQKTVSKHERFETAAWSMPPDVLTRLKALATELEPLSDPQRFAYLFDWRPDLQDVDQTDYVAYDEKLGQLREQVLGEIFGRPDPMEQLERLARRSKAPSQLGWALANNDRMTLGDFAVWVEREDPALKDAAINFVRRRMMLHGADWLQRALADPALVGEARGALIRNVPADASYWRALEESPESGDADLYWRTAHIEVVPPADAAAAIERLAGQGRDWAAISVAAYALEQDEDGTSSPLDGRDVVELLNRALNAEPADGELSQMTGYYIGKLLDHLVDLGSPEGDIARFEFAYFRLLEHHREPTVLNRALAREPELFVDLVKRVYRGKKEARRKKSEEESGLATQAWWVLHSWEGFPGRRDDGTLDPQVMRQWVEASRLELSDADRADIGDEVIGHAFARSPVGTDGIWPAEPVRDLIESIGSRELENGFIIGRLNSRGITSRGVYDGGQQEHDLAAQYRQWSAETRSGWPRTSRILRSIAESYERDARREDIEAELDADRI